MSSTRETINNEQNSENPLAIQAKSNTVVSKRKIIDLPMNEVKHVKIVEERLDKMATSCAQCNKKLKFISTFTCRCQKSFCTKHRFHDMHACTFDYKNDAKSKTCGKQPKSSTKEDYGMKRIL